MRRRKRRYAFCRSCNTVIQLKGTHRRRWIHQGVQLCKLRPYARPTLISRFRGVS